MHLSEPILGNDGGKFDMVDTDPACHAKVRLCAGPTKFHSGWYGQLLVVCLYHRLV